ncbi:MAG TPA: 50S ribosomal protein L11 methyltransferase, partial [Rhodospirillales bacterium]|nr:50S ribosomal protein L11 methyltransferase [Rhodospirillales bacterium]
MSDDSETWRIEIAANAKAVDAFEAALEPWCGAVSRFIAGTEEDWRIEGYAEAKPDVKALAAALDAAAAAVGASPPKTYIHRLAPRDWAAENLTLFPPLRIGRYFICPTHYRGAVPPGSVSLRLNPGAAFGSGEHASTSGCLRALDWLARRRRFHKALDLGCGSGILAMAMAATWRIGVVAADLDQRAVMVARDNARLNQMTRLVGAVQSNGYRSSAVRRGAPYDLIVCNILANSLKAMAKDLGRHLSKNGVAVLSGFYARDAAAVLAAHRAQGLRLMR